MSDYNSTINKEELAASLSRYESTLKKLLELGLNVNPSRLKKYIEPYEQMITKWGTESVSSIVSNRQYASVLFEVHQMIEIGDKLLELKHDNLTAALKKTLSGCELYSVDAQKKKANSARDFSFELFMARYFKRAGYDLNFDTIADINATDEQDSIFIECKRPAKEETVGPNIQKALKQAIKRFDPNDKRNQKGIAAIDLTALINPEHEFLVPKDLSFISDVLKNADHGYAPAFQQVFSEYGTDCLSIIVYFCFPVFQLKDETIGIYDRCFSIPIYDEGSSSEEVFLRMNDKLMTSIGK
ncbi:hypothetical protein IEI94_15130 [Halomonas sp. ML-15]|uniref:hypothetical protein n=1 Tax=Halomonas sp. ML-15 TaxID=2773305 RepID=UPI001746B576|nr:hypothetical protein [Halomonas sp. ML-15]MBD3897189.1 hypothetical protein [Halomonas sp. ML-15]